jgi:tetratricopeptide (TPR) repeat protein
MRIKYLYPTLICFLFFLASCSSRDNAQTYYDAGIVCIAQNDLENAVIEFNRVIALNPDMIPAYAALSYCCDELGNEELGSKYKKKWEEEIELKHKKKRN